MDWVVYSVSSTRPSVHHFICVCVCVCVDEWVGRWEVKAVVSINLELHH